MEISSGIEYLPFINSTSCEKKGFVSSSWWTNFFPTATSIHHKRRNFSVCFFHQKMRNRERKTFFRQKRHNICILSTRLPNRVHTSCNSP